MKQWRCSVCNHVHKGNTPPEICPICKVPSEKFQQVPPAGEKKTDGSFIALFGKIDRRYHVHPISVHIPNGVLPISVIFLALALVFKKEMLLAAAHYNMIAVFLSMPFVIASGIISWKYKYKGVMTPLFRTKLICAFLTLGISGILVAWQMVAPAAGLPGYLMLCVHIVLVSIAGAAGYLGGKLVFR